MPLGDDLTACGQGLSLLILQYSSHDDYQLKESVKSDHIYNVVESKLETDIDDFMRVGCWEDVVPGRVVPQ